MVRDIRQAKKSVNLETYIFQPDRAGRLFADALIAAAQHGVEVRLLVDAWGSKFRELEKEFEDAGVEARKYRPIRLPLDLQDRHGARTARSSSSTAAIAIHGRPRDRRAMAGERPQHQGVARHAGPRGGPRRRADAGDLQRGLDLHDRRDPRGREFYPAIKPAGNIDARPGDQGVARRRVVAAEDALLRRDRERHPTASYIQNAYFLPDKQVRKALVDAAKRGVDVQIMVPGRNIDLPMVRLASWRHYGELLEAGVQIYEYQPTMMHNKTMVVDGIFSTIGSINFDARSMSKNAEESLAFYDQGFAGRWRRCSRGTAPAATRSRMRSGNTAGSRSACRKRCSGRSSRITRTSRELRSGSAPHGAPVRGSPVGSTAHLTPRSAPAPAARTSSLPSVGETIRAASG